VSRRRKLLIAAGAALAAILVAALLLAGQGSYETYPGPNHVTPQAVAGAPAWTKPCWVGGHDGRRIHVFVCARLRARVIWVSNEKVEHGGDAHLVTVAGRHIRFAKLTLSDRRRLGVPGIGDRVTLVGPVVRGAHVHAEVWAWSVDNHGI
jgi:hypothetical protein